MSKQKFLKIVNLGLIIAFIGVAGSIAIYKFFPGTLRYNETVGEIHEIFGMAFNFLAILHLFLNWQWIRSTFFKSGKRR